MVARLLRHDEYTHIVYRYIVFVGLLWVRMQLKLHTIASQWKQKYSLWIYVLWSTEIHYISRKKATLFNAATQLNKSRYKNERSFFCFVLAQFSRVYCVWWFDLNCISRINRIKCFGCWVRAKRGLPNRFKFYGRCVLPL